MYLWRFFSGFAADLRVRSRLWWTLQQVCLSPWAKSTWSNRQRSVRIHSDLQRIHGGLESTHLIAKIGYILLACLIIEPNLNIKSLTGKLK